MDVNGDLRQSPCGKQARFVEDSIPRVSIDRTCILEKKKARIGSSKYPPWHPALSS